MDAMTQQEKQQAGLNGWQHGAVFVLACLLVISRRPDAVLHAQFCSEDGRNFFADAYNLGGWQALLHTYAGYLHTVPRMAAGLALLVPLTMAPLVTNVIAILVQAVPVNLLLCARSAAWGSLRYRALMAAAYLALADNAEVTFGITQANWILALGSILLLVAALPRGRVGRAFDCVFLVLAGLSGPFCVLLLPIAGVLAWKRKETWSKVQCALLAGCAFIQLWYLVFLDPRGRPKFPVGYSAALLMRMLGGDVILGALLGRVPTSTLPGAGGLIFLVCAAVAGVAMMTVCFVKANVEMKAFVTFAAMVLAASLLSPTVYPPAGKTMWGLLVGAAGIRYWFLPSLAFAWTLLWCVRSGPPVAKFAATILLFVMVFGDAMDWRNPRYTDMHWAAYARRFEAAPPGTVMTIPEYPPGWEMELKKAGTEGTREQEDR
jgi:hypothetical protein